jgi:glucokinase
MESDFALAVDIGGSKMAVGIIDTRGEPLAEPVVYPLPFGTDQAADPEALLRLLEPQVEQARRIPGVLHGIGLSVCGLIDEESGEAVLVPNLHWRYVPFGRMVRDRFGLAIYPSTDVRMAVLGEVVWGAAREARHFAWVTIGTGFGAYLYLDGKLYGGKHGFAGNIGHNTIDEVDGYPCGCGRKGCLETYVAGPAIARAGQAALETGTSPALQRLAVDGKVTTGMVFQAEAMGDPAAAEIIDRAIGMAVIGLAGLVNTLDLELIVLGGGVAHGCPDFPERVDRQIRRYLMSAEAGQDLQIKGESLPNSALFGAAADVFVRRGLVRLE